MIEERILELSPTREQLHRFPLVAGLDHWPLWSVDWLLTGYLALQRSLYSTANMCDDL